MQPQGTALVNTAYFSDLTAQINATNVCTELQALVNSIMAMLQAEVTAIKAQIAALLPLLSLPTDLGSVITWITHFAGSMSTPYTN